MIRVRGPILEPQPLSFISAILRSFHVLRVNFISAVLPTGGHCWGQRREDLGIILTAGHVPRGRKLEMGGGESHFQVERRIRRRPRHSPSLERGNAECDSGEEVAWDWGRGPRRSFLCSVTQNWGARLYKQGRKRQTWGERAFAPQLTAW